MATYNNTLRDLISFLKAEDGPEGSFSMILPNIISLDLDGISGIVIGNLFNINQDTIPNAYKGLSYVVRKIKHNIVNSNWTSTIEAYPFISNSGKNNINNKRQNISYSYSNSNILVENEFIQNKINSINPISNVINNLLKPTVDKTSATTGMKTLLLSQAQFEGFKPGTRPYINNNPGNLSYSSLLASKYGAKGDPRFAIFSSLDIGVSAQIDYIQRIISGGNPNYKQNPTLQDYLYTYAPPSDNNTENYLNFVISYFSNNGIIISRSSKLSDIVET